MAASTPSLDVLKKQNDQLREELSRLESLARELSDDNHNSIEQNKRESMKTIITSLDDVKAVFQRYDTNHNNLIDKNELQYLAASLGEVWDDSELDAAFKAIDTSKDGNISFNEFYRWWTADDRVRTEKSGAKLAVLRAKLAAQSTASGLPRLIRALSEVKLSGGDNEKDWCHYEVSLAVGHSDEKKESKSFAHLNVNFNDPLKPEWLQKLPQCGVYLTLHLKHKKGSDVAKARAALNAVLPSTNVLVEADGDNNTFVVLGTPQPDPMEAAKKLNVDFAKFVADLSVSFDLDSDLHSLIDTKQVNTLSLASLLQGKIRINTKFRKELMYVLANLAPQLKGALIASFLEKANYTIQLGDIEPLAQAALKAQQGPMVAEELARMRELHIQQFQLMGINDMNILHQTRAQIIREQESAVGLMQNTSVPFINKLLSKDFQPGFSEAYTEGVKRFVAQFPNAGPMMATLQEHFHELDLARITTASGYSFNLQFKDLVLFDLLPASK